MLSQLPMTRAAGMGPLPKMLEEANGFDCVSRVFASARFPISLITERHHWVPLSFLADLFHFASQATGDPLFGIRAGQRMLPEQFGRWAIYGLQAPTLAEMIVRLEKALPLHTRGTSLRLSTRGNGLVAWQYTHSNVSMKRFIQHSDHLIPVMLKALRPYLRSDFGEILVEAPYRCSRRAAADREQLTSVPWTFGKSGVGLVMPERMLSKRFFVNAEQRYYQNDDAEINALIEEAQINSNDSLMLVETLMLLRLMNRETDIEGLASMLGLSTRVMQRDLAKLGHNYRTLLNRIRMQRAAHLIDMSDVSLTQIALELNYSDLAHFSRAFKLYFGYPPSRNKRDLTVAK